MGTRKKWSTTWDNPALGRTSHGSKKATYEWVAQQADQLDRLRSKVITVWMDQGMGRGWERYERVNLREHAAAQP